MSKSISYILCGIAILTSLLFTSCGSKKNSAVRQYTPDIDEPAANNTATIYTAMTDAYKPWTDVSVPVKISIEQPKKINLSGTAKLINGKAVQISLRMLGLIEVAQIYIDTDSIVVVSKPMSIYCSESTSELTGRTGLDLSDIQCLLLGQAFIPGKGVASASDFSCFKAAKSEKITMPSAEVYEFGLRKSQVSAQWVYTVIAPENGTPQLGGISLTAGGYGSIISAYAAGESTAAGLVSPQCSAEAAIGRRKLAATVTWTLDRAKWNSSVNVSRPKMPSGVRRVQASKLIEMLKKM